MKKNIVRMIAGILIVLITTGCSAKTENEESAKVRIGSLKGPTTIGLLSLEDKSIKEETEGDYEFQMVTAADELLGLMVKGDLDIALVPANMAAILYQRTEGNIAVLNINTLGVLYMVSGSELNGVEDLTGKTIYLTGKGTTPDYALQYVLNGYGLTEEDYILEYKSEATEVAAMIAQDTEAIGLLPQPFVTAACAGNEELSVVLDLNKEWEALGGTLVTGVTVVRKEFLEKNQKAVEIFQKEHQESVEYVINHVEESASLVANAGIVANEGIALKAIPNCNITYIDGNSMKEALEGYLEVLYSQNPDSVGGNVPDQEFYFLGK